MHGRRHLVRRIAHFLHDVYLTTHRPWIRAPVVANRHHPPGRPCSLALGKLHLSFYISILPSLVDMGINAGRIDAAVFFQTTNLQTAILYPCNPLSVGSLFVYIVLKLVVHPVMTFHFVCPVASAKRRTFVKLVIPYQFITRDRTYYRIGVGHTVATSLDNLQCGARRASHERHRCLTTIVIAILLHRYGNSGIAIGRALRINRHPVIAHRCCPFMVGGQGNGLRTAVAVEVQFCSTQAYHIGRRSYTAARIITVASTSPQYEREDKESYQIVLLDGFHIFRRNEEKRLSGH